MLLLFTGSVQGLSFRHGHADIEASPIRPGGLFIAQRDSQWILARDTFSRAARPSSTSLPRIGSSKSEY